MAASISTSTFARYTAHQQSLSVSSRSTTQHSSNTASESGVPAGSVEGEVPKVTARRKQHRGFRMTNNRMWSKDSANVVPPHSGAGREPGHKAPPLDLLLAGAAGQTLCIERGLATHGPGSFIWAREGNMSQTWFHKPENALKRANGGCKLSSDFFCVCAFEHALSVACGGGCVCVWCTHNTTHSR